MSQEHLSSSPNIEALSESTQNIDLAQAHSDTREQLHSVVKEEHGTYPVKTPKEMREVRENLESLRAQGKFVVGEEAFFSEKAIDAIFDHHRASAEGAKEGAAIMHMMNYFDIPFEKALYFRMLTDEEKEKVHEMLTKLADEQWVRSLERDVTYKGNAKLAQMIIPKLVKRMMEIQDVREHARVGVEGGPEYYERSKRVATILVREAMEKAFWAKNPETGKETPYSKTPRAGEKFSDFEIAKQDSFVIVAFRAGLHGMHAAKELGMAGGIGIGLTRKDDLTPVEWFADIEQLKGFIERVNNGLGKAFYYDPMHATGGSSDCVISFMMNLGLRKDKIVTVHLCAAPEGVDEVATKHPEVKQNTATLLDHLNNIGYIENEENAQYGDAGDKLLDWMTAQEYIQAMEKEPLTMRERCAMVQRQAEKKVKNAVTHPEGPVDVSEKSDLGIWNVFHGKYSGLDFAKVSQETVDQAISYMNQLVHAA